jgi:hypothetical protein
MVPVKHFLNLESYIEKTPLLVVGTKSAISVLFPVEKVFFDSRTLSLVKFDIFSMRMHNILVLNEFQNKILKFAS